jgi:Ran GTPase-activating protein (RanGAP) involved in mRNA processing and transport
LDVSCNPITNKGFNIIAKALPEIRKLRKLWLIAYDIGINDESFKIFLNEFNKLPPLLIVKFDFKV